MNIITTIQVSVGKTFGMEAAAKAAARAELAATTLPKYDHDDHDDHDDGYDGDDQSCGGWFLKG